MALNRPQWVKLFESGDLPSEKVIPPIAIIAGNLQKNEGLPTSHGKFSPNSQLEIPS
jgi:hypothetical protein